MSKFPLDPKKEAVKKEIQEEIRDALKIIQKQLELITGEKITKEELE